MTNNTTHEKILPSETTYQELYQPLGTTTTGQNIWFLIWILKQIGCDVYLNEIILSAPFSTSRKFLKYRYSYILGEFTIRKNGLRHGSCKYFSTYETHSISYSMVLAESKWFNGKKTFEKLYICPQ